MLNHLTILPIQQVFFKPCLVNLISNVIHLVSTLYLQVEQLSHQTGEESVLLTASISDGTLSHLGSESGKIFLDRFDDFKSQFLGFCIKSKFLPNLSVSDFS